MSIISNGPFHLWKSISLDSIIFYFGYIVYQQNKYFPWIRWSQIHMGPFIFSTVTPQSLQTCLWWTWWGLLLSSLLFYLLSPMSPLNLLSLFSLICPGSTSGVRSVESQRLCVLWVLIILSPSVSQRNTTSNISFFANIHHACSMTSIYFCAGQSLFFFWIFRDLSQEWRINDNKEIRKQRRKKTLYFYKWINKQKPELGPTWTGRQTFRTPVASFLIYQKKGLNYMLAF